MTIADRVLVRLGLRRAVGPERDILARLARATVGPDDYLANLEHAVMIAQAGGVEDRILQALLHLGATRMMTPETERHLREVGINTRPWAEVAEEWKQ